MSEKPLRRIPVKFETDNQGEPPIDLGRPLLAEITSSLYDLYDIKNNEGERVWSDVALTSLWYKFASADLAAAFRQTPGLKIIVNGNDVPNWTIAAKTLFGIADAVAIRDTRPTEQEVTTCGMPTWQLYNKSRIEPPAKPILLKALGENGYWSSTSEEIAGRGTLAYMLYFPQVFAENVYDWLFREGRSYQNSGRAIFAPFVPDLEIELEFLKHGISISDQLNAESLWSNQIDFLNKDQMLALATLSLPRLNGIGVDELARVREDYRDEFERFSRAILKAVTSIKASSSSEDFMKECRGIQRDIIDENVDKLTQRYKLISKMRFAGAAGITLGAIGVGISGIAGAQLPAIVSGVGGSAVAGIALAAAEYKERFGASENPMHFLWRLHK